MNNNQKIYLGCALFIVGLVAYNKAEVKIETDPNVISDRGAASIILIAGVYFMYKGIKST